MNGRETDKLLNAIWLGDVLAHKPVHEDIQESIGQNDACGFLQDLTARWGYLVTIQSDSGVTQMRCYAQMADTTSLADHTSIAVCGTDLERVLLMCWHLAHAIRLPGALFTLGKKVCIWPVP